MPVDVTQRFCKWGISKHSTLNDSLEFYEEYKDKCTTYEVNFPLALHAELTAYNQNFILLRAIGSPNYPFVLCPQFPFGEF